MVILKTVERDGIHHARVMGVEGHDVVNPHADELLESHGAVKRLTVCPQKLTALIQEGHDDRDPAGFPAHRGDDPFQILKVIVRGHVIEKAVHFLSDAVVTDIHHHEQVVAADRTEDLSLSFSASEAGGSYVNKKGRMLDLRFVQMTGVLRSYFLYPLQAPGRDVGIDLAAKFLAAPERYDAQISVKHLVFVTFNRSMRHVMTSR
jgi:hypothetical protein